MPAGRECAIGGGIAGADHLAQKVVDTVGHRLIEYLYEIGNRADRRKLPIEGN